MATIESLKIKNADGTTSDYAIGAQAENIHYSGSETVSEAILALKNSVDKMDSGKANKKHASASMDYGIGSKTEYGHVRISDNYTSTDTSLWEGTAASLYAVHDLYENLKAYIEAGTLQLLVRPIGEGGYTPVGYSPYSLTGMTFGEVFASNFSSEKTIINYDKSSVTLYPKFIVAEDSSPYILFEQPKKNTDGTEINISTQHFVSSITPCQQATSADDIELGEAITFDFSSNYYGLAGPSFDTSNTLKLYLYKK